MNKTLNYARKSIVIADKAKLFTVSVNKNVKHIKKDGLSLIKIKKIPTYGIPSRKFASVFMISKILKREFCVHK